MTKARTLADNFAADINGITAGTGITGGGTSGTVTVTNSMATAIDAKGDLVVGTGADTFARLAVGTNGYTLVADSSTATGLAYAAPSAGALTKIAETSFSNVASQSFDNLSGSYSAFLIILSGMSAATPADDLQLRFRYTGTTISGTQYTGAAYGYALGALSTQLAGSAVQQATISKETGEAPYGKGSGFIYISKVTGGANIQGQYTAGAGAYTYSFGWGVDNQGNPAIDGFLLKSSSTNITGTAYIYGIVS